MKKNIKKIIVVLILFLFISSGSVFADTIKVGIYENMPLVGIDDKGNPQGFFVDIFNFIAKKEKWDIKYELDTFDNNLKKIEEGDIDILLVVAWSSERAERFIYNDETIYSNWGQVYSIKDKEIDSILDLQGKTLGVEKEDIHYVGEFGIKNTLESFNVEVNYKEYPNRLDILQDLDDNLIDAAVVSRLYGEYYESDHNIKITPIQFNPTKIKIIAGEEKNQYILDIVDKHLVEMKKDESSIYNTSLNTFLSNQGERGLSDETKRFLLFLLVALFLSVVAVVISRRQLSMQNEKIKKQNEKLKNLINNATKMYSVKKLDESFDGFIKQLEYIMETDEIEVVVLLKNDKEYILDTEEFIEGKYKKFAGKKLKEVNLKYVNEEVLDKFILLEESLRFYDKFILAKFMSSYKFLGVIYIETGDMNIDEEIISICINEVILNLMTIISNLTKDKEQKKMMVALGEIIEKRDYNVFNHVRRVSLASKLLAEQFGYSEEKLYNIEVAASVHDIGKILVSDIILNKPGKLTVEEFEIVKMHTIDSFAIFRDFELNLFKTVDNVVRYHHENWDGTGYPGGLIGNGIPLDARIVSIIDVFDALMHKRSYKEAWPIKESLEFINSSRKIKFDQEVVDKFMGITDKIVEIFEAYPQEKTSL